VSVALIAIFSGTARGQDGESANVHFQRGREFVQALRCAACHTWPGLANPDAEQGSLRAPLDAPALDRLVGNLHADWLIQWLTETDVEAKSDDAQRGPMRRMPSFGLSADEAADVAACLLTAAKESKDDDRADGHGDSDDSEESPDSAKGQRLALTLGCLACHTLGDVGESDLFGGGDLTEVARKRPAEFFDRWLADPATINRDHRMPVFELSDQERRDLAVYLATLVGREGDEASPDTARTGEIGEVDDARLDRGRRLIASSGCVACHVLPESAGRPAPPKRIPLQADSDWKTGCLAGPDAERHRPGYRLAAVDREAIRFFITRLQAKPEGTQESIDARLLLAEKNCLACHARDTSPGIAPTVERIVTAHSDLAAEAPAMVPPALFGVGDKLQDDALAAAISRSGPPRRPWLLVRMPRYRLSPDELKQLTAHFVNSDRQPPPDGDPPQLPNDDVLHLAGARLVTSDGFGCTSCHAIGKQVPREVRLETLGPDLSMLGSRLRREWFDRFVRNPAQLVPRMEMPAVQLPVGGVLADDLDVQLAAVWHVLNEPGFSPPPADAVRVVRQCGVRDSGNADRAAIITDVFQVAGKTYIKPLAVGLSNRHSVLVDLESNRLAAWWIGDVARLRTEGKSWHWEPGGGDQLQSGFADSELFLVRDGKVEAPLVVGQFPTELDGWRHTADGVEIEYRLRFANQRDDASNEDERSPIVLRVRQSFSAIWPEQDTPPSGFTRTFDISRFPNNATAMLRLVSFDRLKEGALSGSGRALALDGGALRIEVVEPTECRIERDGTIACSPTGDDRTVSLKLRYLSNLPVDRFPVIPPTPPAPDARELHVVPGYTAVRLPLSDEIMPTALAWQADGALIIASLNGRVWQARDTDGDGLEDAMQPFSDDLAAPYGLATGENYVDVTTKYALVRLFDHDDDGRADRTQVLASGWGHTDDYHDWTIGLPSDAEGNYYVGLACQQDKRPAAAANLRGQVLKLVPREATPDDPHLFAIQPLSRGHRFPMGLALDRAGELFVTDNQGNYNPFNELNHVRPGADFGFINAVDTASRDARRTDEPAINIPHPWTRSVNGICFLYTPPDVKERTGRDRFGPFEGHLIGCEYDTRRLVRMSLECVDGVYQGAAYPFSLDEPPVGPPMMGPVVCAVSPGGDLYVGSMRDSGWGGGNNVGELVRLSPIEGALPCGIAEVRARNGGFSIRFTAPVDRRLAGKAENYNIESYTRRATPAYGGSDVDRRTERIESVEVASDTNEVTIHLGELREGYVYELRLENLAGADRPFFPSEAHYTLHRVPR